MFVISLQTPRTVRRIAFIGFGIGIVLLALTFVVGADIKGARRWINFPLVALQPSEFVKPCFAVVSAWLFSEQKLRRGFPGNLICAALMLLVLGMLIAQPDIGMAAVVATVWFGQFYMAGLRLYWAALFGLGGVGALAAAYTWLPHVKIRVDHFLDPTAGDSYQVTRSLEAFANGGLWGRGPGEGTVKYVLPDAHADFVFAVVGEEFGLIVCLVVVALFAFVVLRGLVAAAPGGQPVRAALGHRPVDPVRAAGDHQHGLDLAHDADQGDDSAVSILRRLLDAGARIGDGDAAGADPPPARGKCVVSAAFVLAAGGTGGHLFPAEALALELIASGAAGASADRFARRCLCHEPARCRRSIEVRAGRIGGGPVRAAHGLAELAAGAVQARRLLRRLAPQAVIGFGGYPSLPTMVAAASLGLPTLIHEQNAVLGRANRRLAPRAWRIATGFPETIGLRPLDRIRAVQTGNPVRPAILAVGEPGYRPPLPGGRSNC